MMIPTNNFFRCIASQSKACSFRVDFHCSSKSLLCSISHAIERRENAVIKVRGEEQVIKYPIFV